jgi:hypothetical protein
MSSAAQPWKSGDYLTHRSNPELGIGRVTALEGRTLLVDFPRTKSTLRLAGIPTRSSGRFEPGRPVRITATRERRRLRPTARRHLRLASGQTVVADALWPLALEGALIERLALGDYRCARGLPDAPAHPAAAHAA